jgi:hypothetical protein
VATGRSSTQSRPPSTPRQRIDGVQTGCERTLPAPGPITSESHTPGQELVLQAAPRSTPRPPAFTTGHRPDRQRRENVGSAPQGGGKSTSRSQPLPDWTGTP